jgi:ABC-type multidrug transport system fused ATPase/permease subunit
MAFTVIGQGILVFFILLFLFWLDGVVFLLLSLSMAFFSILFLRFSNRRVQTLGEDIHHLEESRDQTVIHGLEGIRETRLFQCETFFQEKLQNVLRKLEVTEANFSLYSAIPRSFLEFFTVSIVIVVVLLLVGRGVNTQEILVKISVFAVAAYKLLPSLALLINSLTYITYGQHSLQILAEDINASENHSEIDCPENQNVDFSFSQNIRFEKITFTYPERQTPVLNELSFTIKKNQVTGLTGVSGSGKTTAVDLLLGFLEPKSGTILVDGLLIDRNSSAWRSKIASVSQNVYIADLSLKENIAFGVGEEQFDEQLFAKVLQMAELTDFAAELPQGSATMVGERGICLSGGQKQRVGIARALYSCPEILILDEATSFLDSCMEEKILGGIKSEFTPMTVLFITHRISAMKHCQNVLYLQDGVISEAGSFEQLPKNLIPTQ